jgi:predicted MFS family arabinose efflux permease
MATLFGIVFFGHQVGSLLGVWLGGVLYEAYGSYDAVWWMAVALGLFAALTTFRSSNARYRSSHHTLRNPWVCDGRDLDHRRAAV